MPPINLTGSTRHQRTGRSSSSAPSISGMPEPPASGAKRHQKIADAAQQRRNKNALSNAMAVIRTLRQPADPQVENKIDRAIESHPDQPGEDTDQRGQQ